MNQAETYFCSTINGSYNGPCRLAGNYEVTNEMSFSTSNCKSNLLSIINLALFTLDEYHLIKDAHCDGIDGESFSSLTLAKSVCTHDDLCTMVDDRLCEGSEYRTCKDSTSTSTMGSCVWIKATRQGIRN